MSAVSLNGEVTERTNDFRYLGIHFDRIITYKMQTESTNLGRKKSLPALVMAAKASNNVICS